MKHNFLIEIGTEELPPKKLRVLGELLSSNFKHQLKIVKISYDDVVWYASPCRLAIKVLNISKYQSDIENKYKGPSLKEAFDDTGNFTYKAKMWADKFGININSVEHLVTANGTWLFYRSFQKGQKTTKLIFDVAYKSITRLNNQQLMYWGMCYSKFIRPVHTVLMLFDDILIDGKIFGISSNNMINGHKFMSHSKVFIGSVNDYIKLLRNDGKVIVDYEERKLLIKNKINHIVNEFKYVINISNDLLEEVTSLVEWPEVLIGQFKKRFLDIPVEILIYVIQNIQKCFPVYDMNGKILPIFLFVVNIKSSRPDEIVLYYEKVIFAKLKDVEFFLKTDTKKQLINYVPLLNTIIFHKDLGTMKDKTDRLMILVKWIATKIGANPIYSIRAALLSKCDLLTRMVNEFSDMQGIIGMYYACLNNENKEIAVAIKEQYQQPTFSGDNLPSNDISSVLSIADKIDTIVSIIGLNKHITGNKDPFALRRAAYGILYILINKEYNIDLIDLVKETTKELKNKLCNENIVNDVIEFIYSRIYSLYRKHNYHPNIIKSVLICSVTNPLQFDLRIKAISYFCTLNISYDIIQINKRINNMLKEASDKVNNAINPALLKKMKKLC